MLEAGTIVALSPACDTLTSVRTDEHLVVCQKSGVCVSCCLALRTTWFTNQLTPSGVGLIPLGEAHLREFVREYVAHCHTTTCFPRVQDFLSYCRLVVWGDERAELPKLGVGEGPRFPG